MKKITEVCNSFEDLLSVSLNYSKKKEIRKIVLFAKGFPNIARLQEMIEADKSDVKLIVTSFPRNLSFYRHNESEELEEYFLPINDDQAINQFKEKGVEFVFASLPLSDIIMRNSEINQNSIIRDSLSLIHEGLPLAVDSVLIATDSGITDSEETVLSIVMGLAVEVKCSHTRNLFHPEKGLKVSHIIATQQEKE